MRLEVIGADGDAALTYPTQVLLIIRGGLVIDVLEVGDDEPPTVELLFFEGCPNHTAFLPHLRHLLHSHGVFCPVQLIEVAADEHAQQLRFLGSPSLRVDGIDVEPEADSRNGYGLQCRIYRTPDGPSGTPLDTWILGALHAEHA